MTKQEFVAKKVPILMNEGKYSRQQAIAISTNMFEKEGRQGEDNYAQQGRFNQPVPQNIGYTAPNLTTLPSQGYDFSYTNNFNPQPIENNPSFGQNQFSNPAYSVSNEIGYNYNPQKSFTTYNQTQNTQEASNPQNPYTQNSVNITNPYGNVSLENALNFAGEGFGSKDYGKAVVGTGLSVLKGARNFLTGFSTGKENKRVGQEYFDNRFADNRNFTYGQQGGKISNADVIAQNAIVDQGEGNVNLEGSEFVMRNTGQIQPVIGDKHIENGKKADGVNAQLEDGDKVLSNYVKLKPADIKDLKERYDISLKKGVTFADAQKKLDQKLGIKKLETEKADILEKLEKATKIKDLDTKQLSLEVLTKKTGDVNEKLNTLAGIRADNFEFLFQKQEAIPKKGSGVELYDKNGKEVTESNEEVAQQGMQYNYNKTGDKAIVQQDVDRINKNTSIQFTPDFAKSYFSTASTPIAPKQPADYSQIPVLDITSDGQWSDRKVWRTQRPEWFVGKQEPMEGRDYTVVPYKQWGEYQKGQEYQKFSGNNQQLAELQQGGQIETLAKKHGISMERAQELMSYKQQGGEQQEVSEENQMQQVFQMAAQMIQQGEDPNAVIEALISQGIPHEISMQVVEQVMGEMQAPQNEMPQEEMVEEEVLQQGGEKEYYEEGGEYTKEDQKAKLDDFYRMSSGLGYEGKKEIGAMQNWMADNYPDEVVKYFTVNGQPLTAKHVDIIKDKYKDTFKDTGIPANKKSEDYTEEEKLKLQTALGEKADQKFLLEGFKDNKWDWRFPMVAQKPIASIQGAPQAQITAPNLPRFYTPQEEALATEVTPQAEVKKQAQPASGVRNIMPNFGSYIPLFSAMSPIAKETIEIPRMDAIKTTVEPYLAEQERQRLTDVERIEQAGMSPQQTEALLSQGLYSSQMAANDAISKVEQYNAQNQFQADNYNLGAQAKEDIMNAQFRQNFQDKSMQTLANQEESMRNQYRSNFLQEQANANKVINMNTANALNDQFAITPTGVIPLNNKAYEIAPDLKAYEAIRNMTTDEYNTYKKMMALKGLKN